MAYNDPEWEEWDKKARNHYETQDRGWTTIREEREKMRYDTPSGRTIYVTDEGFTTKEPAEYEAADIEAEPKKGRTIKSRIKSKLRKIKSEKPVEIVDVELEAARKKGYDAHKKDQRARELVKAEKQGRRDAMTVKSKIKEGAGTVREKVKPVGKRVAKNAKGLVRELATTPGQIVQTLGQTAIEMEKVKQHAKKQAAAKPQAKTQKKAKPGPAVRKGNLGKHEGGLPVKSKKDGPGRREGGLPVKSNKPGPGHKSNKPAPVARSGYKPGRKSAKPLPQNIPKTAVVHKARSVNFAMKKRSRK